MLFAQYNFLYNAKKIIKISFDDNKDCLYSTKIEAFFFFVMLDQVYSAFSYLPLTLASPDLEEILCFQETSARGVNKLSGQRNWPIVFYNLNLRMGKTVVWRHIGPFIHTNCTLSTEDGISLGMTKHLQTFPPNFGGWSECCKGVEKHRRPSWTQ